MPDLAGLLVFPFFLVFARLGAAVMVFPAISDPSVSVRIRLLIALAVSAVMFPLVQAQLPPLPAHSGDMVLMMFGELVIGVLMGYGARVFMAAMSLAGELIGFMAGFQAATLFDPTSGSSTAAPTILLTLCAGLLMLVLGLHYELIKAVAASYSAFPPGQLPDVGDVTSAVVQIYGQMFSLGLQLAAPVVVAGLLTNALFGVMNRLIPQLQVFFVSIPLAIGLSLIVLGASLGTMLELWSGTVAGKISVFQVESTL
ncbi:MAG: flagellar biosynthetic protein FliR [Proteobacteria bacterium]|nr:flagellar biosynthetic protein FliR [Pseudomonadota bacterium]